MKSGELWRLKDQGLHCMSDTVRYDVAEIIKIKRDNVEGTEEDWVEYTRGFHASAEKRPVVIVKSRAVEMTETGVMHGYMRREQFYKEYEKIWD